MKHALKNLAAQFRTARQQQGLSQRQLSTQAGIPQSHISKIEKGNVDLRLSSLVNIGRALNLEITLIPRNALPIVKSITNTDIHNNTQKAYQLNDDDD